MAVVDDAYDIYEVTRNIESLEEIVDEVPEWCIVLKCIRKNLRSLRGIERLPQITTLIVKYNHVQSLEFITKSNVINLDISYNHVQSLEFIAGSKVTFLDIDSNQISSLEFIAGSKVTFLDISHNQIKSFKGIAGSNITFLIISHNEISSLEFIIESNVINLNVYGNPCYREFKELNRSLEKVREKYSLTD